MSNFRIPTWCLLGVFVSLVLAGGLVGPHAAAAETTFTYVKIVDGDTPIPGGSGNFTIIGQPGLVNGVVTFRGVGAGGQSGIYTRPVDGSSPLAVRYDRNTAIPGTGGTAFFTFLEAPIMSPGGVAFHGRYAGGSGIYSDVGAPLHVVADVTTAIPGGTGTFVAFGAPWVWSGVVVFRARGSGSQDGIYAYSGGTLRPIADTGTPVPGGTGTFVNFGSTTSNGVPATDDGVVVFRGRGSAGEHGVYKEVDCGTTRCRHVVADLNTPIPGGTGNFTSFEGSFSLAANIEDGAIVFLGEGAGGQRGLYLHDGTSLSVVIDTHTVVPGTAATLTSGGSQGMGIHNGHVSFLGDATSLPQAVYATLGGVLRTVVAQGTVIDGHAVNTLGTYGRGIDGNMVAFHVTSYGGSTLNAAFVAIASNDAPTAVADTLTVPEDRAAPVDVLANDTDADGDVLFVAGFTNGSHGTVTCSTAGVCTYVATTANFSGSDQFTYTVSDGRGGTAVGTVNVTIAAVDDANIGVTMTPLTLLVGRGRTLTYPIVVTNAGPDTARTVSLVDILPAGTSFASVTTTQGTVKAPPVGGTGTVRVTLGALARGATATINLTVNVLALAPSVLTNTATVSNNGTDPVPGNNSATVTLNVTGVGTFVLAPVHTTVAVGDHARLALEWTIPGPSWRELKDLQLRVRDKRGTVLWIRLIEGVPMLLALHDDGRFGRAKEPGSPAVLSSATAKVYLAGTTVQADGPTDPSVVLTLDVSFKKRAGGRTYVVEVKASDDLGNAQDWKAAGTLTVTRRHGRDRDDDD